MTTKPQARDATKSQRRLAKRQEQYDKALKNTRSKASELDSRGAIHRPGSNNK